MEKNLIRTLYFFTLGFLALLLATTYWQIFRGPELGLHPRNPRLMARQRQFPRGGIHDRYGEVLAESILLDGEYGRRYHNIESLAHTIGYSHHRLGQSGLESALNKELAGLDPKDRPFQWAEILRGQVVTGNSIFTTIDVRLQEVAQRALEGRRGAIVALVPATGEIIALVSNPGFNPNTLTQDWERLRQDPNSPLLNRVTQGRYPPGSAFKVFTLAAALQTNAINWDDIFLDQGKLQVGNYTLTNPNKHPFGSLNLRDALAVSSNVIFGQIGLEMGQENWVKQAQQWHLNKRVGVNMTNHPGVVPSLEDIGRADLAQLAIGQGALLVTPLHMALLTSVIANGGRLMQPYLVAEIHRPNGSIKFKHVPKVLAQPLDKNKAWQVGQAMEAVVNQGTGTRARIPGIRVAGKTGTAQNPHGPPHSWFIAYAPLGAPQIALAVVVEQGGSGGVIAAPIAKTILEGFFGLPGT